MEQSPNGNTTPLSPEGQAKFLEAYFAGLTKRGVNLDKWWKERNAQVLAEGAADTFATTQASDQPAGE